MKFCCEADGLKLQVDEDRLSGGKSVGDVLLLLAKRSESLVALIESGLRAILPGVMLGSSSIVLICDPYNPISDYNLEIFMILTSDITFHGLPGSNSGTKSVYTAADDGCDDGQSLFSESGVESGQPSLALRPDDQVLYKTIEKRLIIHE